MHQNGTKSFVANELFTIRVGLQAMDDEKLTHYEKTTKGNHKFVKRLHFVHQ